MKKINKTNLIYLIAILFGTLMTIGNALTSIANNMYTLSDFILDIIYFVAIYMFIEILYLDTKKRINEQQLY